MENYREHAKNLCQPALELIEHILVKHDSALIEELHNLVKENKKLRIQIESYSIPKGWKLVPIKPTSEWLENLKRCGFVQGYEGIIKGVLSSAPQPNKTSKQ